MSFYYLATPYSKYKDGIEEAFVLASKAAAKLIEAGIPVYSPIAHTHPIALYGNLDPLDHNIWLKADQPMMDAARGLIVLMADGWLSSYGISVEIAEFSREGKPIFYMDEGLVPQELSGD